jgi:hypothetical protein
MNYVLSFECKFCGWDWLGGFAYCPNCKRSEVKIMNFETIDEFTERLMLMEIRQNAGYFLVEEDFDEL